MKILLGIDASSYSDVVVQTMAKWFGQGNNDVRVLYVVEPIAYSVPPQMSSGYAPEQEQQVKAGRAIAERAAQALRKAGLKAESVIEKGDPRELLIDKAAEWPADLVVIGAHGRKGIQRFLLGNVAEHVARHAAVSVLIVRCPG